MSANIIQGRFPEKLTAAVRVRMAYTAVIQQAPVPEPQAWEPSFVADRELQIRMSAVRKLYARSMDGVVYAIDEGDGAAHVKFGFTANDVANRVKELQTGNARRLRVAGCWPGTVGLERYIHRRFDSARAAGEWFALTPQVACFVLRANELGMRKALEEAPR